MDTIAASAFHPSEVAALLKYKFLSEDKTSYKELSSVPPESSPDHNRAMCYYFLNKTSRSFARVIQELDAELRDPVCIFYLVLRGLDTIEDDMSLPLDVKLPLLRRFHEVNYERGWTFTENSPEEKDRILLERYDVVVEEFLRLKPEYQAIITDITKRMGNGMAEFVGGKKVVTLEDYDLYTHYVAGLVGHGLTGLFVESGLESRDLSKNMEIANLMGLFLQKTNILKDYLTDIKDGRLFWPQAIWGQYVAPGEGVEVLALPENRDNALACLNHLCGNALALVPDCLEYLSMLRNKSVLNFAAIPQLMAIASIALFYNNPDLFKKSGNKIRRGLAVKLIGAAGDFEQIKQVYYEYAVEVSNRSRAALGTNDADKSYGDISEACANIVRWIQIHDKKVGRTTGRSVRATFNTQLFLFFLVILIALFIGLAQAM
ncbi:isoprenoid synthase domain-containing protein [Entophlyctis helioformis]|nr:isoprenoid synthase domain-containing protein [Entophlyctis helioformis]